MSFGRAQQGPDGTQTRSFWQEQAKKAEYEQAKQKKFTYKDRRQGHTLRNSKNPAFQKKDGNKSLNRTQTTKQSRQPSNKSVNQQGNVKKSSHNGAKTEDRKEGMVSLTQAQLDNLLETVAELTLKNETRETSSSKALAIEVTANTEQTSLATDNIPVIQSYHTAHRADSSPDSGIGAQLEDHTRISVNASDVPGLTSHRPIAPPKASDALPPQTHITERPPVVPTMMTKAERKRLQWEKEKAEQEVDYSPWGRPGAGAPVKDTEGNVLADFNSRRDHTSKNPGKPPPTNNSKQKLTASTTKKIAWNDQTEKKDYLIRRSLDAPILTNRSTISVAPLPGVNHEPRSNDSVTSAAALHYQQSQQAEMSAREVNQPAAIRSSFAFGAAAPDENKFTSVKEQKRQEWLKDLEQQKLEKQLEKQKAKEAERKSGIHDHWADRMTGQQPLGRTNDGQQPVGRTQNTMHNNTAPIAQQNTLQVEQNLSSTLPVAQTQQYVPTLQLSPRAPEPAQELDNSQGSTFLRGQNMFVDPQTLKEMDEKRKREREHQEAIRAQVEEKERKKREEKERQMKEDAQTEEKLKAERDRLANEYENEQQKQKLKQQEEQLRVQRLKEAFDRAQEEADRLKHEQRMKRLQKGGHDTARLNNQFQGDASLMLDMSSINPTTNHNITAGNTSVLSGAAPSTSAPSYDQRSNVVEPSYVPGLNMNSSRHNIVEPTYVPGLHTTPRGVIDSEYVEDRVLTPSSYRTIAAEPLSPRREYGTQTDPSLVKSLITNSSRKNPPGKTQNRQPQNRPQNRPPPGPPAKREEKRVRVLSAPESEKHKRPVRLHERPRWGGGGKPAKKLLKNSEKDPFYERRKKTIEEQRERRQMEMLEESERFSSHVPRGRSKYVGSISGRQRSKSHDARSRAVRALQDPSQEPVSILRHKSASPSRAAYSAHTSPSPGRHDNRISPAHGTPTHMVSPHSSRGGGGGAPSWAQSAPSPLAPHVHDIYAPNFVTHVPPSPPVPALRHGRASHQSHYSIGGENASVLEGDYQQPYLIRTDGVLDPSHAEDPLPASRENTNIQRGRKAYIQSQEPANYGESMENHIDPMNTLEGSKNPILNPALVTEQPTARQGRILQQLSDLRKGLIQKQKEIEVGLLVTAE